MLSNAYFLAKFRFDTAENEPAKNLQNFRKMHFRKCTAQVKAAKAGDSGETQKGLKEFIALGKIREQKSTFLAKCYSFSEVSAPIFASKYAFCSIFQNLPDYLAEFFYIWQHFANFATFAKFLLIFQTDFLRKF